MPYKFSLSLLFALSLSHTHTGCSDFNVAVFPEQGEKANDSYPFTVGISVCVVGFIALIGFVVWRKQNKRKLTAPTASYYSKYIIWIKLLWKLWRFHIIYELYTQSDSEDLSLKNVLDFYSWYSHFIILSQLLWILLITGCNDFTLFIYTHSNSEYLTFKYL